MGGGAAGAVIYSFTDEWFKGGEQVRDFLSPDEIASTIVKISLQNKTLGIINCCNGKPVKLKDFVTDLVCVFIVQKYSPST